MLCMIHKLKNIKIFSNGSVFFGYTTSSNIKIIHFLEKDNKNYILNIKDITKKSKTETFSNYKNKYIK
jgi:hypothetical protein